MLRLPGVSLGRGLSKGLGRYHTLLFAQSNSIVLPHHAGAGGNNTWEFRDLDLNRTLSENGVAEESELYESLDMHHDSYVPVLHVYWNDDLTVA